MSTTAIAATDRYDNCGDHYYIAWNIEKCRSTSWGFPVQTPQYAVGAYSRGHIILTNPIIGIQYLTRMTQRIDRRGGLPGPVAVEDFLAMTNDEWIEAKLTDNFKYIA